MPGPAGQGGGGGGQAHQQHPGQDQAAAAGGYSKARAVRRLAAWVPIKLRSPSSSLATACCRVRCHTEAIYSISLPLRHWDKEILGTALCRAPKPHLVKVPSFEEVFAAAQRGKTPASAAAVPAPKPSIPGAEGAAAPACQSGIELMAEPAAAEPQAGKGCPAAAEQGAPAGAQQGGAAVPPTQLVGETTIQQLQGASGAPVLLSPPRGQQQQPQQEEEEREAQDAGGQQQQQPQQQAAPLEGLETEEDDDLEIVSQGSGGDEEGGNLVELPSTTKKKRMPFVSQVPACLLS
jgi:hypothetical protein